MTATTKSMQGKVAIVTGGGRGIGREECLLLAAEGARVVVNDAGRAMDGAATDERPAAAVAEEVAERIRQSGGEAVANFDDVTSFEGAQQIIACAMDHFGRLDALVNNAGIVRDRMLCNMSEEEFDSVIAVHLKGHFNCARWAAAHWREESKTGRAEPRHIVNTTSASGLLGNPGQTNYGAAKAGIAAMTQIWSRELERYQVRVNAIAPIARTRLTEATFGAIDTGDQEFDLMDPGNIAPLAVYLASDLSNAITGEVFALRGGDLEHYKPWAAGKESSRERRYTVAELADIVPGLI